MFHDILVAIDGSETAQRALQHAIDLADALHAKLTILTVAPEAPAFARGAAIDVAALEKAAQDEAAERLRVALELVPDSVSVTTILRQGSAAKEILAISSGGTYDLLVMGSRGRSTARRRAWVASRCRTRLPLRSTPTRRSGLWFTSPRLGRPLGG